eukprot:g31031.t1
MPLDPSIREALLSPLGARPMSMRGTSTLMTLAMGPQEQRAIRRALWTSALPAIKGPLRTAFEVDRDNAPALEELNGEEAKEKDVPMPPMWENLDGLPEVKVTSPAVAYFSKESTQGDLRQRERGGEREEA